MATPDSRECRGASTSRGQNGARSLGKGINGYLTVLSGPIAMQGAGWSDVCGAVEG